MENREAIEVLRDLLGTTREYPHLDGMTMFGDAINLAISALKEQEHTKEAIPHRNYQYLSDYWCECGWHLGKKGVVKFCADCGRRIKWD